MGDRFHRAAQDGYLEVLREATKKDTNAKDEDGMTPTLWAAFEGNLDALRLLVGRGGDPERSDNYGNTALHLASARGHMNCVTFLVNFGVNAFYRDIDSHTPQELASMNDCTEILKFLDMKVSEQEQEDPKRVKRLQEQAEKEHQKLLKNFSKVQKKADKKKSKVEKEREEEARRMEVNSETSSTLTTSQSAPVMNFSDMVGMGSSSASSGYGSGYGSASGTTRSKKIMGTVFKKAAVKKATILSNGSAATGATTGGSASAIADPASFKIREKEVDGKLTVRNLSGLRRNSDIMFVKKNVEEADIVDHSNPRMSSRRDTFGIFDRPGFGNVTFRRDSMAATLYAVQNDDSIGSEGDRDKGAISEEDEEDEDGARAGGASHVVPEGPIDMFLAGIGLGQYIKAFRKQKIDLDSLMLLTEDNLMEMDIEIGPRKKILQKIAERKAALAEDTPIEDSKV